MVGGKTTGVAAVAAVAADGEDTGVADDPPHEPLSAMTSGAATNTRSAIRTLFNRDDSVSARPLANRALDDSVS